MCNMVVTAVLDIASTYGWDTVFGIHIGDANKAIARAGSSPRSFSAEDIARARKGYKAANQAKLAAAKLLGIGERTLWTKLKKHDI